MQYPDDQNKFRYGQKESDANSITRLMEENSKIPQNQQELDMVRLRPWWSTPDIESRY